LIYDPETSGGLLIAIDADKADALLNELREKGEDAHRIGEVVDGEGIHVTV
jgi:selenide,water dikinase